MQGGLHGGTWLHLQSSWLPLTGQVDAGRLEARGWVQVALGQLLEPRPAGGLELGAPLAGAGAWPAARRRAWAAAGAAPAAAAAPATPPAAPTPGACRIQLLCLGRLLNRLPGILQVGDKAGGSIEGHMQADNTACSQQTTALAILRGEGSNACNALAMLRTQATGCVPDSASMRASAAAACPGAAGGSRRTPPSAQVGP